MHVAITILVSKAYNEFSEYANELLNHFVTDFVKIYGKHHASHNIHSLLHLSKDVEKYGQLDVFSAFKFENFMQTIKKMIRKSEKPLQQFARRLSERKFDKKTEIFSEQFLNAHSSGPLIRHKNNLKQYKVYVNKNFTIDCSKNRDNCLLLNNNTVIIAHNIFCLDGDKEYKIIGEELKKVQNLYTVPCDSSLVGIHVAKKMQGLKEWPVSSVVNKMWKIPLSEDLYVVNSLLHI